MMIKILFGISVFLIIFALPLSYADSSENDVTATVLEFDGISASIQIMWNSDDDTKHKVGCVSCMPNTYEFLFENSLIFENVTPFPNSTNAMLYLISYNLQDEIIHAKQIVLNLEQ